ncbi:MAG: DUF4384 domain-containing protein [Candidatus Latescibacteria bacterium]|nr:DUF4384 domain-containing protein [Candidatus Latescibacterota bacterium]
MRHVSTLLVFLFCLFLPIPTVGGTIIEPDRLTVDIWTDRGYSPLYYPHEEALLYFRASHDAYVTIYDVDPAGAVRVLFPYQQKNNFVKRNRIYRIFGRSRRRFIIEGPPGIEQLVAVASIRQYDPPKWPIIASKSDSLNVDPDVVDWVRGDVTAAIAKINSAIISETNHRDTDSAICRIRIGEIGVDPRVHILIPQR